MPLDRSVKDNIAMLFAAILLLGGVTMVAATTPGTPDSKTVLVETAPTV